MLDKTGIGGALPEARGSVDLAPRATGRAPNQYALETPEGRFEIAELSSRGLNRNRRYSHYDAAYEAEMAQVEAQWEPDSTFADSEWERAARTTSVAATERVTKVAASNEPVTPTAAATASGPPPSANVNHVKVVRPDAEPLEPVAAEPYTAS